MSWIGVAEFAKEIDWRTKTGRPHSRAVITVCRWHGLVPSHCFYEDRKWYLTSKGADWFKNDFLPTFRKLAGEDIKFYLPGYDGGNGCHIWTEWCFFMGGGDDE